MTEVCYTKKLGSQSIVMHDNVDDDFEKNANALFFGFNNDDVWMSHYKSENTWTTLFWKQEKGEVVKNVTIKTRSSIDKLEDRTKRKVVKHLVEFGVVDKPRFGMKLFDRIIDELTVEDKEHLYHRAYSDLNILNKKTDLFFFREGRRNLFNSEAVANHILTVQRDQRGSNVLSMDDTKDELFLYDNGTYYESINDIIIQIRELMGAYSNTHYVNESLAAIRMKCLVKRELFNKENGDINMTNGIFNYNTQKFRPHSIEDLFTSSFNIEYDKDAKCDNIMTFLEWALPDEKHRFTVIEEIAYMFVNGYPIQRLFFWQGPGGNGKGTIMNDVIAPMFGTDNISHASLQDLEQDKNYSQQELFGKKLNMCGDIPSTATSFDFINKITGGDGVLVRRIYKAGFTLHNAAKVLFAMNLIPPITNFSEGPLRRLISTPWYSTKGTDGEVFSQEFMASLSSPEELSGFFNMLMKLIPDLLKRGDFKYAPTPEQSQIDLENLRGTDIEEFIKTKCVSEDEQLMPVNSLYELYKVWSKSTGSLTKPIKMFEQTVKGMNFKIAEMNGMMMIFGLRFA